VVACWASFLTLVLVFGNPWLASYWQQGRRAGGIALLRGLGNVLTYPEWWVPGVTGYLPRSVELGHTLRTGLIVVAVGVLLLVTARSLGARPSGLGVVLSMWAAVVLGAGLAALLVSPVLSAAVPAALDPSFDHGVVITALAQAGGAAAYGFWAGWLPALLAAVVGRPAPAPPPPTGPLPPTRPLPAGPRR
jgi:hypothetical protein